VNEAALGPLRDGCTGTHRDTAGSTPCGTSPRTWCPVRPTRTIGSPPPVHPDRQRSRMTTADGRSPGSRIAALRRLPGTRDPSGQNDGGLAAYSCGGSRGVERESARTAFPFDPQGEPSTNRIGSLKRVSLYQIYNRGLPKCGSTICLQQTPAKPQSRPRLAPISHIS